MGGELVDWLITTRLKESLKPACVAGAPIADVGIGLPTEGVGVGFLRLFEITD
jgi:hypothetical protein